MSYTVPQIEGKAKIIGPLTGQQSVYIGGAIGIIIFLRVTGLPFFLFAIIAIILLGSSLALAFMKIGGRSLPVVAQNFVIFSTRPKIYIWKKKIAPPKVIKVKPKKIEEKIEEKGVLRVAGKSYLQKISSNIETRTH